MPTTTITADTLLAAPLATAWEVMDDLPAYGAWNPFVVGVEGASRLVVGSVLTLRVRLAPWVRTAVRVRVTDVEHTAAHGRLTYTLVGLWPRLGLVRSVREQRLAPGPEGRVRYSTEERFEGALAGLLPERLLTRGFQAHAQGLKDAAEARAAGAS